MLTGTVAKARGEYVRTHFKNTREVAAAISGAYTFWMEGEERDGRELEVVKWSELLEVWMDQDRGLEVWMRLRSSWKRQLGEGEEDEDEDARRREGTRR